MNDLRNDILTAFHEGTLLRYIYKLKMAHEDIMLEEELVSMHNEGIIDIITAFKGLQSDPENKPEFFVIRNVLEKVLPRLSAPIQQVMDCVLYLVKEAGQDFTAGALFTSYADFCTVDLSRPKEALIQIELHSEQLVDLFIHTIIAGARIDVNYYFEKTIRLVDHFNKEMRSRAILALGLDEFAKENTLSERAFVCLERSVQKENDDNILATITKSTFNLYKHNKSFEKRIIGLINVALSKGKDFTLHAASELFGIEFDELPETLLDSILEELVNVNPNNKLTLDIIDLGLVKLLKQENPNKGIGFLEKLLLAHSSDLSIEMFDNVTSEMRKIKLLNKLVPRWFMSGETILCKSINSIFKNINDDAVIIDVDFSEMITQDHLHVSFLARKTIGYLFYHPITVASVIVSLMRNTNDEIILKELSSLIYDPLLINYPGKVKNFLDKQKEKESGKTEEFIKTALKFLDDYLDGLKSAGIIPELKPPQTQREAYKRHFSILMSESRKKAEKESVILSLVSRSILLYGRKSINHVYGPDRQLQRIETPLYSHEITMEFPRMELVDPFYLDYTLRVFRAERIEI